MRAVVEVRHSPIEIAQGLLLDDRRSGSQPRLCPAGISELPAAVRERRRRPPARTPHLLLLQRQVPDKPGMAAVLEQPELLLRRRKQPEPAHNSNTRATVRQNRPGSPRERVPLRPKGRSPLRSVRVAAVVLRRAVRPKALPIPAVNGRACVSIDRGQSLGPVLIADALARVVDATRMVGARLVAIIDALSEAVAVKVHEPLGFRRVPGSLLLVQRVVDIAAALSD